MAQLALAGVAAAQQPAPDELEEAKKQIESGSQALLKAQVSMSTEPAFQFKA